MVYHSVKKTDTQSVKDDKDQKRKDRAKVINERRKKAGCINNNVCDALHYKYEDSNGDIQNELPGSYKHRDYNHNQVLKTGVEYQHRCDEFPFASSNEGGHKSNSHCVPLLENNIQGNYQFSISNIDICNKLTLGLIEATGTMFAIYRVGKKETEVVVCTDLTSMKQFIDKQIILYLRPGICGLKGFLTSHSSSGLIALSIISTILCCIPTHSVIHMLNLNQIRVVEFI